jgi:DNA-binding response OmpR family regulator
MMNGLENYTLLYAEDDKELRENYADFLREYFKEVYEVGDGLDAMKSYKEHLPDILLLDISMPKLDGLSFAKKIREIDDIVKIVILTAHGNQENLLKAVKLNLVDYILKPTKRSTLLETLSHALYKEINMLSALRPVRIANDFIWYPKQNELFCNTEQIHLTQKEVYLLTLLCSETSRSFTLQEIQCEFEQKEGKSISLDAVRGVIKRLRVKMPDKAIENDFGIGYKLGRV